MSDGAVTPVYTVSLQIEPVTAGGGRSCRSAAFTAPLPLCDKVRI